ncbi:isoprenoid synthase domain-containing protein [Aspergillus taichungensis]|uniref:Isoprenoid synthase domain-containing protein n=1 Tax=Aspergillus taichungensis TaxID=482145 RepID=A0A2J5I1U5_9EURO|nr:isoprenoid synthase domain-containing protein [Aspergillus taichungensis]
MMDMQQMDDFITAPGEVDYALLESCKAPSSLCEYGGKVQPVGKYGIQDFQNSPPQDPFEMASSSPNSRASDSSLPVEYLEHAEHQETTNQSEDEMNYFLPPLEQPWTEYLDKSVNAPYRYVASLPGKDFRGKILAACNVWLQIDKNSLATIERVVTMLHNASLLIDDIQDGSTLRRGSPAAHEVYGVAATINSGNYVYFEAQSQLLSLPQSLKLITIFNEELVNLHRGQGMDIYWRDTFSVPTEAEYLHMISNKTGGLFRLAIRLMMAVSESDLDLLEFTNVLGLLFQIQDDYKNLTSHNMEAAKGFCEDLTEGKFSYPIIHAIHSGRDVHNEIIKILRLRTDKDYLKRHVVSLMANITGSLAYTEHAIQALHAYAVKLLGTIQPENTLMRGILDTLV